MNADTPAQVATVKRSTDSDDADEVANSLTLKLGGAIAPGGITVRRGGAGAAARARARRIDIG